MEIIAKAYVEKNDGFFLAAKEEDESLRTDLGYGGMLMNFIVSPGQDTVLLNRDMSEFIAGYAHLYSYDFTMLNIIMTRLGYSTRKAIFNDSAVPEMQTPLHVLGLKTEWQNFNQEFYKKINLVHQLVNGKYEINFKVTGFDRDPLTSLIIEAKKQNYIDRKEADAIINKTSENYNRYSWSLLRSSEFVSKLNQLEIIFPTDK